MWFALAGLAVFLVAVALIVGLSPLLGVGIFLIALPVILLFLRREPGEPGSQPQAAAEGGGKPSWMRKHWWE